MFQELTEPITKEKEAISWWKKIGIVTNATLLFFLAVSIVCFLSLRLNLEMAIADAGKREYFSGIAFCIAVAVPWLFNLRLAKLKKNHLQELKKNKVMQTKKASLSVVLTLITILLLGDLGFFIDFSLYSSNYQKRQKTTQSVEGVPLSK